MDDISLSTLVIALVALLAVSGFFSIAETAMMAVNRHRLRLKAKHGERGKRVDIAGGGEELGGGAECEHATP